MRTGGVHIEFDDSDLHIRCTGVKKLVSVRSKMSVPRSAILSATVATKASAQAERGWRVWGGHVPGLFATGWYTWRGRRGVRQWWAVFRDAEVLVLDTTLERPARIVVQCPDRYEIARELSAAHDA